MTLLPSWQLRAGFARRLSELYGREVPAYTTLVDVAHEVNTDVVAAHGGEAQRLGSIERVTAERHGAVRVGTPRELAQLARVMAAMGMHPTGYYDLRGDGVPVVSTAFRPVDAHELTHNPFRVFTSLLAVPDRRFFDADLAARLDRFLARRTLFPPRLLELADRAAAYGGLEDADARELLTAAAAVFALSREPVERAWYDELAAVSAVAADIGGVGSTHLNHLTPRVLDIDELYRRMGERGVTMIDEIQGPPRWDGPDVLLRQTSFRALAEPRTFREPDGRTSPGQLRVRFGEVEARGVALTPAGRSRYDALVADVDARLAAAPGTLTRQDVAAAVWREGMPATETALAATGLGVFTLAPASRAADGGRPPLRLAELLAQGWVVADPVVYEDFLPRSAAGIFRSNLDTEQARAADDGAAPLDAGWLAAALERPLLDPDELYLARHRESLHRTAAALDLPESALEAPTAQPTPDTSSWSPA